MPRLVYLRDVVTLELDEERCVGCGICVEVCPHAVLAMDGGRARVVDRDACMECGACATNCTTEAIRVRAGVGCAVALVNAALGRSSTCCCVVDEDRTGASQQGCC